VETVVEVREVLSERNCRVALPNGRLVFGYIAVGDSGLVLAPGLRAVARLNVADFERAMLISPA
jgi:hypothetical protein